MKCATLGGPHEVVSNMNRIHKPHEVMLNMNRIHKTTFVQDRKIRRFRYIFILLVRWLMGSNILTLWLVKNYYNAWWTTMNASKLSTLNCYISMSISLLWFLKFSYFGNFKMKSFTLHKSCALLRLVCACHFTTWSRDVKSLSLTMIMCRYDNV